MHAFAKSNSIRFQYPVQVKYVLHFLPCTHQEDIRLCTTHVAMKAVQLVQLLFVPYGPSSCLGLQLVVEEKSCLSEKQ